MQKRSMNRWVRLIWITIAAGSIPAVLEGIFGHPTWHLLRQSAYGMVYAGCIGVLCTWLLPLIAKPILRLQPVPRWAALIAIISALATVGCLAATAILLYADVFPASDFVREYLLSLRLCILITLAFGLSTFFHQVVVHRMNRAELDLKARDEAAAKLQQAAMEARLSSLESRVQPHFLFNTLNSVLALIREDPAAAERMVERLAALLRFSLDANQSHTVPLSLEMHIVRDYLEIERARFGSRLRFSLEIPKALDNVPIPPMSVQTIVENSVKYAVSARREGATILVRATAVGEAAEIEISDDGPGFDSLQPKPGHGLELLAGRMEGLYGPGATLLLSRSAAGGASVLLTVPLGLTAAPQPALIEVAR